jgi:hypothetical protein
VNWIAFPAGDCRIKSLPFFGVVSYPALDVPARIGAAKNERRHVPCVQLIRGRWRGSRDAGLALERRDCSDVNE